MSAPIATPEEQAQNSHANHPARREVEIRFSRTRFLDEQHGREMDVFRLSLGDESILLLPLKNWMQLDVHKWVPRGRLAASPPLEITHDHVKVAGETVSIQDPEGCEKLEKVFIEWLRMEQETLELAKKHAHAKPAPVAQESVPGTPQRMHFQVEVDKTGQVHIRCVQGKEALATIGLNQSGFRSLFSQGLMRKPHALQVGALHDWLELDGLFFSFEKGNNDSAKLEATLNEQYLPAVAPGEGKDIILYANAASPTGFDIQFPASAAGVRESKRRPLNEESLELLQDPIRCGLLRKEIVIKLTRPNFVFKLKNPDGGERYLDSSPENLVSATDEDGNEKIIDLSHPLNYSHLSTSELTAVFNHPAIHKHGKTATPSHSPATGNQPMGATAPGPSPTPQRPPEAASQAQASPAKPPCLNAEAPATPTTPKVALPAPAAPEARSPGNDQAKLQEQPKPSIPSVELKPPAPAPAPAEERKPGPNAWLEPVLKQASIRHDWFACLVYSKIAEFVRSSNPGQLGPVNCWSVALDEVEDVSDPMFKGIVLTEKGGFGFLHQGHLARFNKGVVLLGTYDAAIEGIGVMLVAAGFDIEGRTVFIVSEDYVSKFGMPEQSVRKELATLREFGAVIMNAKEALESATPFDVIWTVPAVQEDPQDPKAIESRMTESV